MLQPSVATPCPQVKWPAPRCESQLVRLTSIANEHRSSLPWPVLCLGFPLPWLPGWVPAETLTETMNAVTAWVLSLPTTSDYLTGSVIVIDDGAYQVTNWHLVAFTQEGDQILAPGARFYLATPAISFEMNYQ